jgi:hypothetical protein
MPESISFGVSTVTEDELMHNYKKTPDDAVSPVIGVLLMLVVTIIIAAVVSGFAGGLTGSQEKAPQASIGVKTGWSIKDDGSTDRESYDISFAHMGGDPINTKDCQIITFLTLPNGTVIKHIQSSSSPYARGPTSAPVMYSRVPHLYDQQKYGYPCNGINSVSPGGMAIPGIYSDSYENPAWFGKATWTSGDIARTYRANMTAALFGLIPENVLYTGGSSDTTPASAYSTGYDLLNQCITNKTQVEIKLLHVPSGKYILDKKLNLQG